MLWVDISLKIPRIDRGGKREDEYLQIEKCELTWIRAMFIDESTGKETTECSSQIGIWDLVESQQMDGHMSQNSNTYPCNDLIQTNLLNE